MGLSSVLFMGSYVYPFVTLNVKFDVLSSGWPGDLSQWQIFATQSFPQDWVGPRGALSGLYTEKIKRFRRFLFLHFSFYLVSWILIGDGFQHFFIIFGTFKFSTTYRSPGPFIYYRNILKHTIARPTHFKKHISFT